MSTTDEFAKHEVLHTASIVMNLFNRELIEHPVVIHDKELNDLATEVFEALYNFYNTCGGKFL